MRASIGKEFDSPHVHHFFLRKSNGLLTVFFNKSHVVGFFITGGIAAIAWSLYLRSEYFILKSFKGVDLNENGGIIGPKTLVSVQRSDSYKLANKVIDQRQTFYENLACNKTSLKKFLKGWTNRNNNLRKFIG